MQMSIYQEPLTRLREHPLLTYEPDARLNPRWPARRINVPARELLGARAYALHDGPLEMHWEVYCPVCGRSPGEFGSLKEAHSNIECAACEYTPRRLALRCRRSRGAPPSTSGKKRARCSPERSSASTPGGRTA
jgi:hypothetical protein